MKRNDRLKKPKKIIGVASTILLALSLILLIFATVYRANDSITLFGYRFYYITTGSMEPDIKTGSFVAAKKVDASELMVGDVISFVSSDPSIKGQINTHSIYEIGTDGSGNLMFKTKGTANAEPDNYLVSPDAVRGRVEYQSYAIGCIFKAVSNRTVTFCITIIPLAAIVIIYFVDWVVAINRPYPDETEPDDEKDGDGNNSKE